MKLKYISVVFFALFLIVLACSSDDDNISLVPDRDRTEQQAADRDSLLSYLGSHYYNKSFFQPGEDYTVEDIVITRAVNDEQGNPIVPEGNELLSTAVVTRTGTYLETEYEYYILKINQGGSEDSPNFSDKVRVNYEGSLITDGSVFDSTVSPEQFDLLGVGIGLGTIVGWQRVMPEFNIAEDFTIGDDGFVNYNNYGLGVMFIPSGMAYFSTQLIGIPSYSNLIFKFELYQTELNDHEGDLVYSYLEDLNNNLDPFDDDTDEDGFPNYVDGDDDGDGVLTRFEDIDGDGDPTNDIGANGIPKYLDPEETESNEEE